MADVSWVKLFVDMFDHKKIKYIRRLPDGNDILLCWIMLISSSGKCNAGGYIFLTENIPYTAEDLADEYDLPINTIRLALKTFEHLNMIEIDEKGIYILGWEEYQNAEGLEKIRQQTRSRVSKHRERNKLSDPVFQRDNSTCQYCGAKATGHDHVIATASGGKESESNKVACCIECNRIKNNHPLEKFLNENRDRINDDLIKNNLILSSHVTLHDVTDRYIVTHGNATEVELDKEEDKEKEQIPYTQIVELYHSICTNLSKVAKLSNQRKKHISARHKELKSLDEWEKYFTAIAASDFLNGQNDRGWITDFDWIINDTNSAKIIEGKYKNKPKSQSAVGLTFEY